MTPTSRRLLKRLLAVPRPNEAALSELFMELQKHSIADLIRICQEVLAGAPPPQASALEAKTKKRLREVDGKASDFVPYLLEEISSQLSLAVDQLGVGRRTSLSQAVKLAEELLQKSADAAVDRSIAAYISDHDTSYKLHSA